MRAPNPGQPNPQGPDQQKPKFRISILWWLVLAGLLIWNLLTYLSRGMPVSVSIPYSTFVEQVKAGNISSVKIQGNQITGNFVTALTWPGPLRSMPCFLT